jgi:hypothetical protein
MATKIVVPAQVKFSFPLTLGVETDVAMPYKYHWRKNGALLAAPSQNNLTLLSLSKSDIGAKFTVTVFGENTTETSPDAVLALAEAPVKEPAKPAKDGAPPPYVRKEV